MLITAMTLLAMTQSSVLPNSPDLQKRLESVARGIPPTKSTDFDITGASVGPRSIVLHFQPARGADVAVLRKQFVETRWERGFCVPDLNKVMREQQIKLDLRFTADGMPASNYVIDAAMCTTALTEAADVQTATDKLQGQLSDLSEETKIYKRLVALENSPQGQMCKGYVGQTIALTDFDTAVARYAKVSAKGEFETTAQYESRRRAALGAAGIRPLVIGVPVDRDYLEYDADKQELSIEPFAFGEAGIAASAGSSLASWLALDNAGLKASVISSTNVAIEVDSNDLATGSYTSGNALGATVRVTKITRTTRTIFDRESDTVSSAQAKWRLFPIAELAPHAVDFLKVSPSQAKALKNSLRLAFLVQPKEPFLVSASTTNTPAATFQRPREMKEVSKILVADIQCGLTLNVAGKVLGAYPTN